MTAYCIIETENGLTVVEQLEGLTAEESANRRGGIMIDPGPYDSYEDACEGLAALGEELQNDAASDVPGTMTLEERFEIKE